MPIVDSSCTATGIDELVTPSLDTSSCNAAQLSFSNQYHQNSGNVEVDISNDAGATWMNSLYMAEMMDIPQLTGKIWI